MSADVDDASDQRLGLLIEGLRDFAIYMLDPQGRVATWNAGAQRLKGYRADEVLGRSFEMFFTPEDAAAGRPARELEMALAQGRHEEEGWRVRRDGERFWASVVVTALRDPEGRLRGFAKVTRDSTERRRAEEVARHLEAETAARRAAEAAEARLRASEDLARQRSEQLSVVLSSIDEGVTAQDVDGKLLFANDAAARMSGFESAQALLAAPLTHLKDRFDIFDEAGRPFDWTQLPGRRALAGEDEPEVVLRIRDRASGREWWSYLRSRAVRDAAGAPHLAVSVWRDVTEQRRSARAARFLGDATVILSSGLDPQQAMARLARLVVPSLADWCVVEILEGGALVPVAIAHVDPAKVAVVNDLRQRYPNPSDAAAGAPAVARTGRSELYEEISDELLQRSGRDEEHLRIIRTLGLRSAMVVPLMALDRPLGAVTLVAAESQRRFGAADLALAEELGRRAGLALENARLYRAAIDAIKLRDDFLSVAGHELKTPLTALLLQVSGLRRAFQGDHPPAPATAADKLSRIVNTGGRLERLIHELLDVSRITSGRLQLERQRHDLVVIAREVIGRFAEQSARAGAPLELDAPEPVEGNWDRLRLDQVLTNLLSNALKYGPGQPVRVRVHALEGDRVRLRVEDAGIGIPGEDQARIFDRFERAVSDRNYGGLGLGLWITRQIVEAHGGTITVASAPGQGAVFEVILPR